MKWFLKPNYIQHIVYRFCIYIYNFYNVITLVNNNGTRLGTMKCLYIHAEPIKNIAQLSI
jgi:hypothetical protein